MSRETKVSISDPFCPIQCTRPSCKTQCNTASLQPCSVTGQQASNTRVVFSPHSQPSESSPTPTRCWRGIARHKSRSWGRKKTRNIFSIRCVAPRVTMRVAFIFCRQVVTVITDSSRKQEPRQCVKFAKGGLLVRLTDIRRTHRGKKTKPKDSYNSRVDFFFFFKKKVLFVYFYFLGE